MDEVSNKELKEILERIENKIDALILNQTRPEKAKTVVEEVPVTDEAKKEIIEEEEKTEVEPTAEN